mgnify:CR=1 FL=1
MASQNKHNCRFCTLHSADWSKKVVRLCNSFYLSYNYNIGSRGSHFNLFIQRNARLCNCNPQGTLQSCFKKLQIHAYVLNYIHVTSHFSLMAEKTAAVYYNYIPRCIFPIISKDIVYHSSRDSIYICAQFNS